MIEQELRDMAKKMRGLLDDGLFSFKVVHTIEQAAREIENLKGLVERYRKMASDK